MGSVYINESGVRTAAVPAGGTESRWAEYLRGFIQILFVLYAASLTCTMAGMEIFSWSSAFFILLYFAFADDKRISIYPMSISWPVAVLAVVAFLGLRLNAPHSDFVYAFGRLRNLALLYIFAYAFPILGSPKRLILVILTFATLIAPYGIWQHYSGIDLWRHNHRALTIIPWSKRPLYSTVGFFNHHLTYAHSFAMILCIPWAIFLIMGKKLKKWQAALVLVSMALIGVSVLFTYGRGAWLALLFSLPAMAAFVNRRFLFTIILVFATGGSILYATNKVFRDRAQSIFAKDYVSNEERRKLWAANFEMFREHPLVGVGLRQNEPESNLYYKKLGITDGMAGHAHNNYIEFLSTTGLIGFLCYMALITLLFVMTLQVYKALPAQEVWLKAIVLAAIGAQITFHIGGLTQCSIGDFKVQHQLFFWFALILYLHHIYCRPAQVRLGAESP